MSSLIPRFTILSQLKGLPAWLAISLAVHGVFFGWLVGQAQEPSGRGASILQVSLVAGSDGAVAAGQKIGPNLRGTTASLPVAARPTSLPPMPARWVDEMANEIPVPPPLPDSPRETVAVASLPLSGISHEPAAAGAGGAEAAARSSSIETGAGVFFGAPPMGDGGGMAGSGGDAIREEARLARQIRPEYPPGALAQGWDGQVLLRLRVDADGNVQQVRVERSSGHEILDRAALRAARNWLFFPARAAGIPIAAEVKVPVVFAREAR